MVMEVNIRNNEGWNVKKMWLCLWPRRILWVVWWMNTGVAVCVVLSRGEAFAWSPVSWWPTVAHGPHPLPRRYASLPGSHLAPCSSAQPPWKFFSGGRQCSIHPGGKARLSLPAEAWLLAAPPLSPSASGLGFQKPDRLSAATGHTGDSCCCRCYCS